jgi:hypothetical protein
MVPAHTTCRQSVIRHLDLITAHHKISYDIKKQPRSIFTLQYNQSASMILNEGVTPPEILHPAHHASEEVARQIQEVQVGH